MVLRLAATFALMVAADAHAQAIDAPRLEKRLLTVDRYAQRQAALDVRASNAGTLTGMGGGGLVVATFAGLAYAVGGAGLRIPNDYTTTLLGVAIGSLAIGIVCSIAGAVDSVAVEAAREQLDSDQRLAER